MAYCKSRTHKCFRREERRSLCVWRLHDVLPVLVHGWPGSGWGAAAKPNAKGFIPFPDYPYYLNDLWVYNLTTGYWTLLVPLSSEVPAPRTDMSMVLDMGYCRSSVDDDGACFGPMLIVFGGYNGSHHFDDTWLFDTRKTRWLEKRQQVHPLWPPGCTDDDEIIANSSCFFLDYAKPVRPDGLIQAQRHDLSDLYGTIHVIVISKTDMSVDSTKKDSPPLVGTSVAPASWSVVLPRARRRRTRGVRASTGGRSIRTTRKWSTC